MGRRDEIQAHVQGFSSTPSPEQVTKLTRTIYRVRKEAYKSAITDEASKWGATVHPKSDIDPFFDAKLFHDAQTSGISVASTFTKRYAKAQANGTDMSAWQDAYSGWKSDQIYQHESLTGRGKATKEFYTNNKLPAIAHVDPITFSCPDICEDLIDMGDVSVETALLYDLPAHLGCPHSWTFERGLTDDLSMDDLQTLSDSEDELSPSNIDSIATDSVPPVKSRPFDDLLNIDWNNPQEIDNLHKTIHGEDSSMSAFLSGIRSSINAGQHVKTLRSGGNKQDVFDWSTLDQQDMTNLSFVTPTIPGVLWLGGMTPINNDNSSQEIPPEISQTLTG